MPPMYIGPVLFFLTGSVESSRSWKILESHRFLIYLRTLYELFWVWWSWLSSYTAC